MAYRLEEKDIVIDGWETGVAETPYAGLGDMRSVDNITIPGEVSIAMSTEAMYTPLSTVTNKSVSVDAGTNIFTWDGSSVLTVGQPIYFSNPTAGNTVFGGMTSGVAYYVREVKSPTTFTVSASIGGAEVDVIAPSNALTYIGRERNTSASATSIQIVKPAGVTAGNIMFMFLFSDTGYATATPTGWTSIGNTTATGYFQLFYKIAQTSDPATWTPTWSATSILRGVITAFSGVYNIASPIQTSSNTSYVTADANLRASTITTTKDGSPILFVGGCYNGTNNRTFTKPADIGGDAWTEVLDEGYNTFSYTWDTLPQTTAGATGAIDATISANETQKHAWAVALSPIVPTDTVFSSINMSTPVEIIKGVYTTDNTNLYFTYDDNGRVWLYDSNSALCNSTYKWIYINNLPNNAVTGKTGNIVCWKNYLFVLSSTGIHVVGLAVVSTMTNATSWIYTWQAGLTRYEHKAIIGQDDMVYFCNGSAVGRIQEAIGTTFDANSAATYIYDTIAIPLPTMDSALSLAELGGLVLIGGENNWVYPWDKLGSAFNPVIMLSDTYIRNIVTVNTTAYIFAGRRGRIFMTNGSNATPFWKVPDYISKTTNPYIIWKDANYNRNQLYFGFSVTNNAGTTINEYGGLWALDVDAATPLGPRMSNKLSYNTYNGYVTAICQNMGLSRATNPSADGYGLYIGWYNGSTSNIDKTISTPYTTQQPYVETELIPIGEYKTKRTFENLEYKLATPLVAGESLALSYRTSINASFVDVPITSGGTTGDISGLTDTVNFENAQWIQIRATYTGTASSPSYVRLKEIRIR